MNSRVDRRIFIAILMVIVLIATACGTLEVGVEPANSGGEPVNTPVQTALIGEEEGGTATIAPTLETTPEPTAEATAELTEPMAEEEGQGEPTPIPAPPGEMTNLDEAWFTDSNYVTPSVITMLDETWFLYTNYELGFSINFPRTKTHWMGSCVWNEENGDRSYRPQYSHVPVKIFEEQNIVYITSEYQHELSGETRETSADGGTRIFFSKCESVMNSLEMLHDLDYYQEKWEIVARDIDNDEELDAFIKSRYGSSCSLGEMAMSAQEGVYDIKIQGDGKDLSETSCPLNYGTIVKYYPKGNKVIAWDIGQAYTFSADVTNSVTHDQEMVDSFRFLTGESVEIAQEPANFDYTGWQAYTNDEMGYSFMYPAGTEIVGGNLNEAVEIVGPIGEVDHSPWFMVQHFDSAFFRPDLGTGVQQWIADSNIPYEPANQETTIGGLPAVHFSFTGSPQAYASDEYYVIYGDQLFRITILHTEPGQDWFLYDQFLNSIAFAPR